MKKLIPLLAAILLLAGCNLMPSAPESPPLPPNAFSSDVAVTYGEYELTAQFFQNSYESYKLKMLTPSALEPLAIMFEGSVCSVTYDDLKFETDLKRFPQTAFGTVMIDVLKSIAADAEITKSYADGVWTYSGVTDAGDFILTQSNETGAWLSLDIESSQLKIVFSNFAVI